MDDKMKRVVEKLEGVVDSTTDYVIEHPIKALAVVFVAAKIIKWIKE